MLTKIISGGQTGADQGGLAAGLTLGIPTGGWAPRSWRTERGPMPELATFGLQEHSTASYKDRTLRNVVEADGTLIFGDIRSTGSGLTVYYCKQMFRPYFAVAWAPGEPVPDPGGFDVWLEENDVRVLNVAGNRASKASGIAVAVHDYLVAALQPALEATL
jgi:hypothetical protein